MKTQENFVNYAAVDIVYKTMACFGIAQSASSGDRNRFNKNMLNHLKENEIPIVYMNTIVMFLPLNPPPQHFASPTSEGVPKNTETGPNGLEK